MSISPLPAEEQAVARPLTDAQAAWLRARLKGRLLLPGEPDYATQRRVFNKRYHPHPDAIVDVADEDDVRTCLEFADREDFAFRVRGGGHNFAGYSAGPGLVIDVTLLDAITLDPTAAEVTVGGGCPQGNLGNLLAASGFQLPLGDWPSVGVGGYMQGGGYGLTSRSFGLNLDHVLELRVMLADGRIVTASETENHDLWWAVRGGTGNSFGVVLSIRYRLRPAGGLAEAELAWSLATPEDRAQAARVMLAIQDGFMRGDANPDTNITCMGLFGLDETDPSWRGPWLMVDVDQVGATQAEAEAAMAAAIAPIMALPGRIDDFDYNRLNRGSTIPPLQRSSRYVSRDLTGADWAALLDFYAASPNDLDTLYLQSLGARMNQVPRESSAFIHRDGSFLAYLDVFWQTPAQKTAALDYQRAWGRFMAPFWNGQCYQNFPEEGLPDFRAAYWGEAWPALLAVKRKYDPRALFTFPQVIAPLDAGAPPVTWPPRVAAALRSPISAS